MRCPFKREDFIKVKDDLINHVKNKGISSVAEYCVLSGIPLIVAYDFVSEELPEYSKQCKQSIKSINDFYGYGS